MRLHDTLLGVLLVVLAAVFFGYTFTFPDMPGQKYGPALFPRLIALGIAAGGIVIAVRGLRSGARAGTCWVSFSPELQQLRGWLAWLAMPLAIVFYLLVSERLGFLPTATLVVGALCAWLGARLWVSLATGVVTALVVQWFFGSLMRVPLPRGWFMQFFFGG
ncbi:MAG: tripartite tricarboxylate transporter TctB family protein [Rubrivivax sp.]